MSELQRILLQLILIFASALIVLIGAVFYVVKKGDKK